MSYKPNYTGGWKSGVSGGTPITPEALNHMESGIETANEHLLPEPQAADNATFLRNDGTWQKVTPANIGAVPTSRTVNGKALSANISLSAADVGAAPSGYGLGETAGKYVSDCYAINRPGFYYADGNTANKPEWFSNCEIDANIAGGDIYLCATYAEMTAKCYYSSWAKAWQPWGYDNPPMAVGVEYRTTKLYKGSPVFVKSVEMSLSGQGTKVVNISNDLKDVASLSVQICSLDGNFSYLPAFSGLVSCYVNIYSHNLQVNSDSLPDKIIKATIEYVK